MWRQFHRSYDRLVEVRSSRIANERVAVVGLNAFNDLYWSRQVNALGVWRGWEHLGIETGGTSAKADAYDFGSGSGGLPLVFVHTATALDNSNFHVLQATEAGPDQWRWTRTTVPVPPLVIGSGLPQVLPLRGNGPQPSAALYVTEAGVAYRSMPGTTASPAWKPWIAINDLSDPLTAISGTLCCGSGLIAGIFQDGSVKISLQDGTTNWSGWRSIAGAPANAKEIKCIADGLGVVHIVVSTRGGKIYKAAEERIGQCGQRWSGFVDTGFATSSGNSLRRFEIALDDNDRVQIAALESGGALFQAWQKNWRGNAGHLGNILQDGRGKYTPFLQVMTEADTFSDFCLFSDPAGRVHVVGLPQADAPPRHGIIWGHRIHIRAVKCRDDLSHPAPRADLLSIASDFARTLEGCNAVFRNCGFSFVFDPEDDWCELANTAINRDISLASLDNDEHFAYADQHRNAVVCFLRWGQWPDATGQSYSAGPFPDPNGNSGRYVALSGFYSSGGQGNGMNQLQGAHLAHELGHYFGLAHTFNGPVAYPAGATREAVFQHLIDSTLREFGPNSTECDVDRGAGVFDTPYDPGPWLYEALSLGGGNVGANAALTITGLHAGATVHYAIAPDTNNVMSYFAGNPPVGSPPPPHHFSPDQIVVMHKALRHVLRIGLLRQTVT